MFRVWFIRDYGLPAINELTYFARLLNIDGFDSLQYSVTSSSTGLFVIPSAFAFKPQQCSLTFFVSADTSSLYNQRINGLLNAVRQFKSVGGPHWFQIENQVTGKIFKAPVVIEDVNITNQNGLSALVTINGLRRTQGILIDDPIAPRTVSTTASGLPKTISLTYDFSFPSPLWITLQGPILAGFTLSRIEGLANFDFYLQVGTTIPSGVSVEINYGYELLNNNPPTVNVHYLTNPEIAPDITIRPLGALASGVNTFTLSGPSSSGIVTLRTHIASWSIYE
jgi:hypothetical protein